MRSKFTFIALLFLILIFFSTLSINLNPRSYSTSQGQTVSYVLQWENGGRIPIYTCSTCEWISVNLILSSNTSTFTTREEIILTTDNRNSVSGNLVQQLNFVTISFNGSSLYVPNATVFSQQGAGLVLYPNSNCPNGVDYGLDDYVCLIQYQPFEASWNFEGTYYPILTMWFKNQSSFSTSFTNDPVIIYPYQSPSSSTSQNSQTNAQTQPQETIFGRPIFNDPQDWVWTKVICIFLALIYSITEIFLLVGTKILSKRVDVYSGLALDGILIIGLGDLLYAPPQNYQIISVQTLALLLFLVAIIAFHFLGKWFVHRFFFPTKKQRDNTRQDTEPVTQKAVQAEKVEQGRTQYSENHTTKKNEFHGSESPQEKEPRKAVIRNIDSEDTEIKNASGSSDFDTIVDNRRSKKTKIEDVKGENSDEEHK